MCKPSEILKLTEEKCDLLRRFEGVTQEMITCPARLLEDYMGQRQRIVDRLEQLEGCLEELCGEDGELLGAARGLYSEEEAAEGLAPLCAAARECRAILSRLPESELQASLRLRQEQEHILDLIKNTNRGGMAKASRFYSTGASSGTPSRLGNA